MVVVRQSPKAHVSPDKTAEQWPPRSPFQALLSSPSGRKRWQDRSNTIRDRDREEDRSPSPSPLRKPMESSRALQASFGMSKAANDEEEEDDDEETLQLQLKAIEAKLKLKKLQKAKGNDSGSDAQQSNSSARSREETIRTSPRKALANAPSLRPPGQDRVEVPVSPSKDRIIQQKDQLSPARVRLGLDAAAKASDVSLKRARDGTQLKKSDPTRPAYSDRANTDTPKPKSFSQRLAENRLDAQGQEEKSRRIQQSRSKGFGLGAASGGGGIKDDESSPFKTARSRRSNEQGSMAPPSIGRSHSTFRQGNVDAQHELTPTRPTSSDRSPERSSKTLKQPPKPASSHHTNDSEMDVDSVPKSQSQPQPQPQQHNSFEPHSQTHLSKRQIPHTDITRALSSKEIYTLPRLLKEVKSPHYEPPDCESDFVVLAILASKSTPFNQKPAHHTSDSHKPQDDPAAPRNKFMVLKLTDLKWEVDCFLFGSAFDQFWKLTPGTLLAILNPSIMPPKASTTNRNAQHSGRFSLKLGSSEDSVMEIGTARDLAWCSSVKKDGQTCGDWVNKTKNDLCEFHVNMLVERERKGRMQVNTMARGAGGAFAPKSRERSQGGPRAVNRDAGTYHREFGQLYSVASGGKGSTAASLLDADDTDKLHSMTRDEASRKRIAAAERERATAKRLGAMGSGIGAEYLRAKHDPAANATASELETAQNMFDKPKIETLGLLGKSAGDQRLSPAKDRKRHFGMGAAAMGKKNGRAEGAMGWGGARKAGLLMPKAGAAMGSPERGQGTLESAMRPMSKGSATASDGSVSPRKKRARYEIVGKGIREPGRESLGEELSGGKKGIGIEEDGGYDDDDDDGLDIV
ncbi:hypothetical protein MBLNU230_g2049t1 [Neophaeotheca triangularis]